MTQTAAEIARGLGQGLLDLANFLEVSSKSESEVHVQEHRPPSPSRPRTREGLWQRQHTVLQTLQDNGGLMPGVDFMRLCRNSGYAQGYGGFYARRNNGKPTLCEYDDTHMVTITGKGQARLKELIHLLGLDGDDVVA